MATDLYSLLQNGVVEVSFVKANGDTRRMKATLNPDLIPNMPEGTTRHESSINVFDLEVNAWRSINLDTVDESSITVVS